MHCPLSFSVIRSYFQKYIYLIILLNQCSYSYFQPEYLIKRYPMIDPKLTTRALSTLHKSGTSSITKLMKF